MHVNVVCLVLGCECVCAWRALFMVSVCAHDVCVPGFTVPVCLVGNSFSSICFVYESVYFDFLQHFSWQC